MHIFHHRFSPRYGYVTLVHAANYNEAKKLLEKEYIYNGLNHEVELDDIRCLDSGSEKVIVLAPSEQAKDW